MKLRIFSSAARGEVSAPPSKSMTHRALICAALAKGESRIANVSHCEDVQATLDCLRALGADCQLQNGTAIVRGTDFTKSATAILPCRESGSTMRFMLPLCLLSGNEMTLVGEPALMHRPMMVYADLCYAHNSFFKQTERGITVKGTLTAGEYTLPGDVSSQFISGMLFPLTQVAGESILHILPPIESRSYIEMTLQVLNAFGADVKWFNDTTIFIGGGKPMTAQNFTVEGDYSNAAFFAALNLLGGEVTVAGLAPASLQGDRVYLEHFASLSKGFATISVEDCPDLAPILFALAAAKSGGRFTDTRRLAIKESHRAEAMATELRKFGTTVDVRENEVIITPTDFHAPTKTLCGHNDHRIVMALAILATKTGGEIEGADAVNKSFPDFFERLFMLGVKIQEI